MGCEGDNLGLHGCTGMMLSEFYNRVFHSIYQEMLNKKFGFRQYQWLSIIALLIAWSPHRRGFESRFGQICDKPNPACGFSNVFFFRFLLNLIIHSAQNE